LMATGLVYDAIGWRSLYIIWAVVMIPIAILAWRFIKPNTTSTQDNSIGLWITRLIWLLKKPLVWICGLSFGLTIATIGNFGFIWNINLQKSLGWGKFNANLLTFVFVIGVIVGGYFVTWLSKHIGEYLAVVINMSIGLGVFIVCVFVTSSLREILVSIPMLFFVGATLGTGTMIQPYIARFFDRDMSAMFFGITTAIYLVIAGIIVSAPMWHLASETNWQASDLRLALIPYFVTIIVGIGIFAMTRLIIKQRINEER
ncbi:MAG: MFS transporter, partial [Phycisphaerales bacterium]|nr:MFS transporter [Phycisphaerales bacterium]